MRTSEFLTSFKKRVVKQDGFTLIEMAVVIGIIAILSGTMLAYSRQNNRQIQLMSSATKLESLISRAQFLSVQSYFDYSEDAAQNICAHGIRIDTEAKEAFIFQVIRPKGTCLSGTERVLGDISNKATLEDYIYENNSNRAVRLNGSLDVLKLSDDDGIKFKTPKSYSGVVDIVFVPPLPVVIIGGNVDTSEVKINVVASFVNEEEVDKQSISIIIANTGQIDVNF
ncbi:prepilin-type N-terminal cleavage/methylation domain-containing protein [Patescibacteria group bacterium]|nr:prepilin-type N-terminal cleavage/methylation domain-containing protein [Patescibacteria group bacterium]